MIVLKFRVVCIIDLDKLLKSLIEMICYLNLYRFLNVVIKWGIFNESRVCEDYVFLFVEDYFNFFVVDCGFYISVKWFFLGVIFDDFVFCECCGKGICEIKCFYKYKDFMFVSVVKVNDSSFCFKYNEEEMSLFVDICYVYYY